MMEHCETVKVIIDKGAYLPERFHETDAGADLRTPKDFIVRGGESYILRTGVHVQLPHSTVGMIKSKSGLNVFHGIACEGVIDEGYTGEIVLKVYNFDRDAYAFHRGDKVAQLVILDTRYPDFEQVDEIDGGERGANGFGSTGL